MLWQRTAADPTGSDALTEGLSAGARKHLSGHVEVHEDDIKCIRTSSSHNLIICVLPVIRHSHLHQPQISCHSPHKAEFFHLPPLKKHQADERVKRVSSSEHCST